MVGATGIEPVTRLLKGIQVEWIAGPLRIISAFVEGMALMLGPAAVAVWLAARRTKDYDSLAIVFLAAIALEAWVYSTWSH